MAVALDARKTGGKRALKDNFRVRKTGPCVSYFGGPLRLVLALLTETELDTKLMAEHATVEVASGGRAPGKFLPDPLTNAPAGAAASSQVAPPLEKTE